MRSPVHQLGFFSILLVLGLLSVGHSAEYWEPLPGPWGGDVQAISADPNVAGRICAGLGVHATYDSYGRGGGVFYSTDSGQTWARSRLQGIDATEFAFLAGRTWVATYGDGVYGTYNIAGAWSEYNTGLEDLQVRCLLRRGQMLIAGTTTGAYTMIPSQGNWEAADVSTERDFWALTHAPWEPSLVLAATDSFIWRSTDGGGSWFYSGSGMDQEKTRSVAIGTDGTCWAGTFDRWNGQGKLYCSADSGSTWSEVYQLPSSHDAVWTIAVSPDDPERLLLGSGSLGGGSSFIYRSIDGGDTWTEVWYDRYRSVRSLAFLPDQSMAVLAGCESGGGVFRSTDNGDTWARSVDGMDASNIYAIAVGDEEQGELFVGEGFSAGLSRGINWGQDWTDLDDTFPSLFVRDLLVWPGEPNRLFAAAWNNVYASTDGGQTWSSQGLSDRNIAIQMSSADTGIVYAAGRGGVYVTHDSGETWAGPDPTVGGYVTALAVDPRNGWHALASAGGSLFETNDGGAQWESLASLSCIALAFHLYEPSLIYVGTDSQGVYLSNDGGETFDQVSNGLPNLTVNAIASDPDDPGVIWAGTADGVYKSLDFGATWIEDSFGLYNRWVLSLLVHEPTRRILMGSYAGGLRWSPIDHLGSGPAVREGVLPTDLVISVAPVPCGDTALLDLLLPSGRRPKAGDQVTIALYSLDGRRVSNMTSPYGGPVRWDLSTTPAGVYLVRGRLGRYAGSTPLVAVK